MKKTLSILLSLVMIISITAGLDFNSFAGVYYESENNNSYSKANSIPLNSSISGSINYGKFENDSDIDYYKVTTTQKGTYQLSFLTKYNLIQSLRGISMFM